MAEPSKEQLCYAGDVLAEMLGYALVAIDSERGFDAKQLAAARSGIVLWHRIKALTRED